MDIIKGKFTIDFYESLTKEQRSHIVIENCEPDKFDYSVNEDWVLLKKESTKIYKKLKEKEFNIRINGN